MQPKIVKIGDVEYKISPLGGVSAARVLLPAARLAPALLEAGAAFAARKFGRAAVALQAAQESDLEALIEAFQRHTVILSAVPGATNRRGKSIDYKHEQPLAGIYDQHFAGKINDHMRWILECFELNFADFLEDMSPASPPPADVGG